MSRHQFRQQKFKEPGFIPIHTKVQRVIHRPCSECGKWVSVIELGFCRYRFVEISYSIEHNVAALPWTTVVRKYTNHICVNTKNNLSRFRMNDDIKRKNAKIITRTQNHNQFHDKRQDNKNRVCIANISRQNDCNRMKPIFMESI